MLLKIIKIIIISVRVFFSSIFIYYIFSFAKYSGYLYFINPYLKDFVINYIIYYEVITNNIYTLFQTIYSELSYIHKYHDLLFQMERQKDVTSLIIENLIREKNEEVAKNAALQARCDVMAGAIENLHKEKGSRLVIGWVPIIYELIKAVMLLYNLLNGSPSTAISSDDSKEIKSVLKTILHLVAASSTPKGNPVSRGVYDYTQLDPNFK